MIKGVILVEGKVYESLNRIIDYLYCDEEKGYNEETNGGEHPEYAESHIFLDVKRVHDWENRQPILEKSLAKAISLLSKRDLERYMEWENEQQT
jgi:hypothetical protein